MADPRLVPGPTSSSCTALRAISPTGWCCPPFPLAKEGLLPADWRLVGNGRGDVAHEDFQGGSARASRPSDPSPRTALGRIPFPSPIRRRGFRQLQPGRFST